MEMKTLGERLKYCRKEKDVTQAVAAKAVGMSQTNLSELEGGIYPTSSFVPLLANYYGVSALWLATGKGKKEILSSENVETNVKIASNYNLSSRRRVPVISIDDAASWRTILSNLALVEGFTDTTADVSEHAFAVNVIGDVMQDEFPDGTTVIVDPEVGAVSGSYAIFKIGDTNTLKQLVIDGGNKFLKPANSRYPIVPMPEGAEIIAVVKQKIKNY